MKTAIIMGTRPEIIKLSELTKILRGKNSEIVFTGQHYDYNMSLQFIKEFGMREPDYKMKLTQLQNTTTDRATQIGEIVLKLAKIITKIDPDTVIVQGDTNTVLAASLTSMKCGIPISHIESGLRSYDWRMPEEHNRITVDHISEFLFAPTKDAKEKLVNEKVHGKIFVTGNTSIDVIEKNIHKITKNFSTPIQKNDFILLTLHRGENVDNYKTLVSISKALISCNTDIVFPAHPRTIKQLRKFGLYNKIKNSKNIHIIPPIGYFDMINLMKKCQFIISDSGGIQEEATAPSIRKKVIVIRNTTDRPEAVKLGFSELVGTNSKEIINAINRNLINSKIKSKKSPYGKGDASKKIANILKKQF
jgi:UDP-N-acetylglucosamine 2-epimerase (non-hydrolysing)